MNRFSLSSSSNNSFSNLRNRRSLNESNCLSGEQYDFLKENCSNDPRYQEFSKDSEKSIFGDLQRINIPDEIKIEAERIFKQLDMNTRRGKRRKKLIYYCVNNAYKTLNRTQDPKVIAKIVGIPPTEITKANSMCSETQTGYRPPRTHKTPLDFLPECCSRIEGLDDNCLSDIKILAESILQKDSELLEAYPQVVAAGILLYYLTIKGAVVNKKQFASTFGISEMTITKMFKRISEIDNRN